MATSPLGVAIPEEKTIAVVYDYMFTNKPATAADSIIVRHCVDPVSLSLNSWAPVSEIKVPFITDTRVTNVVVLPRSSILQKPDWGANEDDMFCLWWRAKSYAFNNDIDEKALAGTQVHIKNIRVEVYD
jgi:hypothetical protein